MHKRISILLALILIFLAACTAQNTVLIDTGQDNVKVNVEIADGDEERAKGLMFREELDESSGMLFVFEEERKWGFWMKNTLIPLDLIFISSDLEIIDIRHKFQPCKTEICESYTPKETAMYVLEVNGGFSDERDIKIGDTLQLDTR